MLTKQEALKLISDELRQKSRQIIHQLSLISTPLRNRMVGFFSTIQKNLSKLKYSNIDWLAMALPS
jgi:hypothetical protein